MQYKIPINIENEDKIIWQLSLRQLFIIFAWGWLAYAIFSTLNDLTWNAMVAWLPAIIVAIFFIFVAILNVSEMTFMSLVFNFIRHWVNWYERYWQQWVDSFSAMDIWYVIDIRNKKEKVDFSKKMDKIENIDEILKKI